MSELTKLLDPGGRSEKRRKFLHRQYQYAMLDIAMVGTG
jgi:hypothetical protein